MNIISSESLAKKLFDDIVELRFSYLFDGMSPEEKHALRNLYTAEAKYAIDEIKNRIVFYKERLENEKQCIVYYRFPHNSGGAQMIKGWQSSLEEAVKIYHTQPKAIIEIFDGESNRRYTHEQIASIIKHYYVVTRRTGKHDCECTNSYLTIEDQAINAFNTWLDIDGESNHKIDYDIFDNADAVMVKGETKGYTYSISKHKMI